MAQKLKDMPHVRVNNGQKAMGKNGSLGCGMSDLHKKIARQPPIDKSVKTNRIE